MNNKETPQIVEFNIENTSENLEGGSRRKTSSKNN